MANGARTGREPAEIDRVSVGLAQRLATISIRSHNLFIFSLSISHYFWRFVSTPLSFQQLVRAEWTIQFSATTRYLIPTNIFGPFRPRVNLWMCSCRQTNWQLEKRNRQRNENALNLISTIQMNRKTCCQHEWICAQSTRSVITKDPNLMLYRSEYDSNQITIDINFIERIDFIRHFVVGRVIWTSSSRQSGLFIAKKDTQNAYKLLWTVIYGHAIHRRRCERGRFTNFLSSHNRRHINVVKC